MAAALAAVKQKVPVGHVEAGLRSFDLRMPEEHNRRLTDHVSTYLFAPTKTAQKNLLTESVWGDIYVTGNTVIDAVIQNLPIARKKSKILHEIRFEDFMLATAHRAENVDNPLVLRNFIEAFAHGHRRSFFQFTHAQRRDCGKSNFGRKQRHLETYNFCFRLAT